MSTPSTARMGSPSSAGHTHTAHGQRTTRHTQQASSSNATTGAGAVAGSDSLGAAQGPQDAFLALLSALGGSELGTVLEEISTSVELEDSPNGSTVVPESVTAQEQPPLWSLTAQLAQQQAQPTPTSTALTAQTAQTGTTMQGDYLARASRQALMGSLQPDGLVAQTVLMDKATELAADKGLTLNLAGSSTVARWMGAALSSQASAGLALGDGVGSHSSAGASSSPLSSDLLNMMRTGSGSTGNGGDSAGAGTGPGPVDFGGYSATGGGIVKDGVSVQVQELPLNTLSNDPVLPSSALEPTAGSGSANPAGTGTHSGAAGGQSSGSEGWTYTGAAEGGIAGETAPSAADAGAGASFTGEESLAEQVAFWVNNNHQSAELTLQRDGQPVQVRVQLSGNEAHVTFGSDQAQTRQALHAEIEQLRQLLQEQGLVLTGASVGQRGAGEGSAAQESQAKNSGREGRQGRAMVAISGGAAGVEHSATLRPLGAASGARTLDLFV